eukprot:1702163-Rhodomonas_salina.1
MLSDAHTKNFWNLRTNEGFARTGPFCSLRKLLPAGSCGAKRHRSRHETNEHPRETERQRDRDRDRDRDKERSRRDPVCCSLQVCACVSLRRNPRPRTQLVTNTRGGKTAGRGGVRGITPCTQLRERRWKRAPTDALPRQPHVHHQQLETNDAARSAEGPDVQEHDASADALGAQQAGPRVQGEVPARLPAAQSAESQPMQLPVCGATVQVALAFGAPTANMGALERGPLTSSGVTLRPRSYAETPARQVC